MDSAGEKALKSEPQKRYGMKQGRKAREE